MFLKIKASKYMDLSTLGRTENYICRIPIHVREQFDLKSGSYIKLKNTDNKNIILQIEPAYKEDLEFIPDFIGVFVTTHVANSLGINKPELGIVKNLTLGMDPEAFIVNDLGHTVNANKFFKEFEIGNDCGLIEFRPNPSTSPTELVDTLYGLIKRASFKIERTGFDIIAASCFNFKPAGFHIHFGYNCGLKHHTEQIKLVGHLLDYILSVILLRKEIREDRFRRGSSNYGKPCDIKKSRVSFEYRVPGGRMIESPVLAIGAISIAEVAIKDFLIKCNDITDNLKYPSKLESYSHLQSIYPTLPSKDTIAEILTNTTNVEAYLSHFEKSIIHTIFNLDFYSERKNEIEQFLNYSSTYQENNLINHWKDEYKKIDKSDG
jgi:bifunctional DNA-binding transcriptional regulator/antitoxin component of YhaV-PrlF toxin-antitoxin module